MAIGGIMDHVGCTGNVMLPAQNGTGFIMQNGGVVPPSLLQEHRIPHFYREAIAKCGAPNPSQLPNTALVYNLMVTSRLPRPVLGNIWSLVNRTLPGQLTRQEFFSCLALIALIQKGQPLSALSTMPSLPIPHLQACAPFAQYLPGHDSSQSHSLSNPPTGVTSKYSQTSAVASTSSALSLLSDINFSMSASSSMTFTQLTTAAASSNQFPTSISQPSLSRSIGSTLQMDNSGRLSTTVVDTRKPQYLTFAKATPSKQFLMNDSQQKENNNILLNPVKAGGGGGGITNASTGIMELVSQSSDFVPTTAYCKPEKINPDAGKLNILEPVRNTDVYAAVKLISNSSRGPEEDESLRVWQRCIEEAHKLFYDADLLLPCSAAKSISEIIQTDRGARYFKALYEIHAVTLRIRNGRTDKLIKQKGALESLDKIWTRLKDSVGQNGDDGCDEGDGITPTSTVIDPETQDSLLCGICLSYISKNSLLEFTGTSYHRQCANLWINRVDSLLPKLKN